MGAADNADGDRGDQYLDTATFQIRGARVTLTRLPSGLREIQGMMATTTFEEVVPSIPIPSYVAGTKILRSRSGRRARVATIETQVLLEVRFLRDIPGTSSAPPTPPPPPGI